jgi:hypothetical protein
LFTLLFRANRHSGRLAFMHREAILDSPETPISHHWLDSTHISFGVEPPAFEERNAGRCRKVAPLVRSRLVTSMTLDALRRWPKSVA